MASAKTRLKRHSGGGVVTDVKLDSDTQRWYLGLTLLIYLAWFVLLAAGAAAYEGEPILVKPRDLPLRHFDYVFRRAGGVLVFGFWLVRAAVARLSRPAPAQQAGGPGPAGPLLVPLVFYVAQALGRTALYWLHAQGYIFHPRRWAEPRQAHPPHVMSDHILLAACAVAALACEAVMPMLSWRRAAETRRSAAFARLHCLAATATAVLVSAESYFTARYFHPPSEIAIGALLGLVFFQAPLLRFSLRALG